jgi:hypothetical protein
VYIPLTDVAHLPARGRSFRIAVNAVTIMAEIKFACPHCSQHITCDELWGGHQLECPSCKNQLAVPAMAAPKPVARATGGKSGLVPKPPAAVEPRLAINTGKGAEAAESAPQRTIPIRNLAPPPPKRKNRLVTYGMSLVVVVGLGIGIYYGYGWLSSYQEKVNAASKASASSADGGQVANIAKLNNALDATDPNRAPADGRARPKRSAAGQENAAASGSAAGTVSTNAADSLPLIPAVWTLDLAKARIPSGRANGSISGTNFLPETARVDPVGNAQVLRLLQGQAVSPEREVLIYLHLKAGEKLGGQTLNIAQETAGVGVPQVTKRWKTNPKFAPQYKSFTSGYAMRLELGQVADGVMPGKIFLALPDVNQSVVAGNFTATINTNVATVVDTATAVQAAPVAAPAPASSYDAAFQARYGVRRQ